MPDGQARIHMIWKEDFVEKLKRLCKQLDVSMTDFVLDSVIEKLTRLSSVEGKIDLTGCDSHYRSQTVDNVELFTEEGMLVLGPVEEELLILEED